MQGRNAPAATRAVEAERQFLKVEVRAIQTQLDAVKNRLAELEAEKA